MCDLKADTRYLYLDILLRIINNQEIEYADLDNRIMNEVQLYYLNS